MNKFLRKYKIIIGIIICSILLALAFYSQHIAYGIIEEYQLDLVARIKLGVFQFITSFPAIMGLLYLGEAIYKRQIAAKARAGKREKNRVRSHRQVH